MMGAGGMRQSFLDVFDIRISSIQRSPLEFDSFC